MPKRGTQKHKHLLRKQFRKKKLAEVRRRTQKQRLQNKNTRYLRSLKEAERELEPVSFQALQNAENAEKERLDQINELFEMIPYRNTYIMRLNVNVFDHNLRKPSDTFDTLNLMLTTGDYYYMKTLEVFFLGDSLAKSKYILFCYHNYGWEGIELSPSIFFEFYMKPQVFESQLGHFQADGDWSGMFESSKRLGRYTNIYHIFQYIMELPGLSEQMERERVAPFTAPGKLKRLQEKGLNALVGERLPPNVQNIVESYMFANRPRQQHIEDRDNLARINTSLFQD